MLNTLLRGVLIKHKGVTEEEMRKKIIALTLILSMVASLSACTKEEEVKVAKPIKDVNSLLDKYIEEESETPTADDSNKETVDYDKIDQELINQIVASGGTVTDGEDLPNNGAAGEIEYLDRIEYRVNVGFQISENTYNMKLYKNNGSGEVLGLEYTYVYDDVDATMEAIKAVYVATYGDWTTKSTYKSANGYTFETYGNNTRQRVNAAFELFLYVKDNYVVALLSVNNKLGSEALRDLADSVVVY